MRFMMIIKGDKNSEAGVMPEAERLAATGDYNTALIDAGALLACEGLHPTSQGFKLRKVGGKITVIDGPFSEAKEVIAGYWIIQANSLQEAIEWAKRVPFEAGGPAATGEVEVRQIADMADDPRQIAAYRSREVDLRTLTPAEVQAEAKRWLTDEAAWSIVVVPEEPSPRRGEGRVWGQSASAD